MTIVNARLMHFIILTIVSTVGFQTGCRGSGNNAGGPLPSPPSSEQTKASDYQPQNPFVEISPGLSTRTVFVVEPTEKDPYHVDVLDILIAPDQQAVQVPLSGAGVFEVRTGSGTATIGQKSQGLSVGSTFSASEGEMLKVEAKRDGPITLRAYVVKVP
jgi:hypothetical protein